MAAKKKAAKKAAKKKVKIKALKRLGENGVIFEPGEVFETTEERAKALGELVAIGE